MPNINTAYLGFWNKFRNFCAKAQLPLAPNVCPFKCVVLDKNRVEIGLSEPIHLRGWPWHHASNKRIHILLDGKEIVGRKTFCVESSRMKVNYFLVSGKGMKPLESIHYDYSPSQAGHPVFHAQVSGDLIEAAVRNVSGTFRDLKLEGQRAGDRINSMKIPTSHVSFASVLSGLVVDHGDPKHLKELVDLIRTDDSLPRACEKTLHDRIRDDGHSFRSFAWYV